MSIFHFYINSLKLKQKEKELLDTIRLYNYCKSGSTSLDNNLNKLIRRKIDEHALICFKMKENEKEKKLFILKLPYT